MAIDNDGNVYVCDWGDHVIRKIDVEGNVSTFAGIGEAGDQLGPIAKAMFNGPIGITIDKEGVIYVVDTRNQKIKK